MTSLRCISRNVAEDMVDHNGEIATRRITTEILVKRSCLSPAKDALVDSETKQKYIHNIHRASPGGTIFEAAVELADLAKVTKVDQHMQFNGLVLTALAVQAKRYDNSEYYGTTITDEYYRRHEERHKRSKYYKE